MKDHDSSSAPISDELLEQVYDELRQVARHYFRRQRAGFTLRPTEMVHEACLHIIQHGKVNWSSPEHFRAIATKKIWQIVIDHLKRRNAQKRGGPRDGVVRKRVALDSLSVEWSNGQVDLIDLSEALDALENESSRMHEVVMLHWFGGLTYAEISKLIDFSVSTIEKDFRYALAWLNEHLASASDHAD